MRELRRELAGYRHAFETTAADRDRIATELQGYKHAFETTAADRDRIAAQLEDHRHAFETTAADRDRLAAQLEDHRNALETTVADRDRIAAELEGLASAFERATAERDQMAAELHGLQATLEAVTADRDRIATKLGDHSNTSGRLGSLETASLEKRPRRAQNGSHGFNLDAFVPVSDYTPPEDLRSDRYASLRDLAEAHFDHPIFNDLVRRLWSTPHASTISAPERGFIYAFMRELKPQAVLEIGTYFAGTTQLMAAAAYQYGGMVYTIDPYGADRAPSLLAEWPEELARRVVFQPQFSTEFLGPMNNIPSFGLIFIDGNHRYPNVLHDVYASDENLLPGGIMIGDNAEQPDVMDAFRHFAQNNPDYEGLAVHLWSPERGDHIQRRELDSDLQLRGAPSSFVIMRKPKLIRLSQKSLSYRIFNVTDLVAPRVTISGTCEGGGALEVVVHLASHPKNAQNSRGQSYQFQRRERVARGEFLFVIDSGLALSREAKGQVNYAEVTLRPVSGCDGVSNLYVGWGDRQLVPGRNFLTKKAQRTG